MENNFNPLNACKGLDYDLKAENLTVLADREGARIFLVHSSRHNKEFRVLAHCVEDAEALFPEYSDDRLEEDEGDEDEAPKPEASK